MIWKLLQKLSILKFAINMVSLLPALMVQKSFEFQCTFIQGVLQNDNQLRNADVELQQRALEYSQLSSKASQDVLATVLEEMPPFPERESSILAKLMKKKPSASGVRTSVSS